MEKQHPLVWIGVGIAGAGLGANNAGLTLLGVAVAIAGAFGLRRFVSELPPGIQKQIADIQTAAEIRNGGPLVAPEIGRYYEEEPQLSPLDVLVWAQE